MSEEQVQQEVEQTEESSEVVEPEAPKSFDEAYVKKLRDEAAGYRVKLKEYEDAQKSEAEKQAERIAELEKENGAFKLSAQRAEWANEIVKGSRVPADALRGDTEEELQAHFEQLKVLIPDSGEPAPKKGAWAPFDPEEGRSPSAQGSTAASFAAALEGHL